MNSQPNLPIHVLFFDHVASMSGGEIALLNLIRHLDRRVIEPVVLLGEDGPLAEKLRQLAEVHILPIGDSVVNARKDSLGASSLLMISALWNIFGYVIRLAVFLRRHRFDALYTNSLKSDVLGGFAAKLSRTKLIWHVRDRIAADYLPKRVVSVFRRLCRVFPDLIIANSAATAATLSLNPDYGARMCVVHDGTDVSAIRPPMLMPDQESVVIGMVGRISPWKGQDIFLRAAAIVHAKYPKVRFRIIGSALFNESDYEASIRRLADELGLQDILEFTGFRKNIPHEISQLGLLVHASVRPEPFGQVIIEGMAAGIPVIATNGGGVPEIIDNGVTGLLVSMGDWEELSQAIVVLLTDQQRARAIALRARYEVQRRFSIQKTAQEIEKAIQNLYRGPSASVAATHTDSSELPPPGLFEKEA